MSPSRGLSSSVKATLLDMERKTYKYNGKGKRGSIKSSQSSSDNDLSDNEHNLSRSVGWADSEGLSEESLRIFRKKSADLMSSSSGNEMIESLKGVVSGLSRAESDSSAAVSVNSSSSAAAARPRTQSAGSVNSNFSPIASSRSTHQLSPSTRRQHSPIATVKTGGSSREKKLSKFRPPPIITFKESDTLTALAMCREYLLYLHDFPSSFEEAGITSVTSYRYTNSGRKTRGGKPTVAVQMFSLSSMNGCTRLRRAIEGTKKPVSNELTIDPIENAKMAENSGKWLEHWPRFAQLQGSSACYYFTHDSGQVESGDTRIKAWPPVRRFQHRKNLWKNLESGVLSIVTSGHMPVDPDLKLSRDGDFYRAAAGVNSIEMMLPAMWTAACERSTEEEKRDRDEVALILLAERMCVAPAKFLGVANRKGSLASGMDADICIWDPDQTFVVNKNGHRLQSKYLGSIYDGKEMKGVVKQTYLRGHCVFDKDREGDAFLQEPRGEVVCGNGNRAGFDDIRGPFD